VLIELGDNVRGVGRLGKSDKASRPIPSNFNAKNISGFPKIDHLEFGGQRILEVLDTKNVQTEN
jgi:hypothetical protein